MARGKRTDLSTLASSVGDHSPVDRPSVHRPVGSPTSVPLAELIAFPHNARDDLGDLQDLASIADTQLAPVLVVSRAAYLALWPEDRERVGEARWVVVNGCRRLAAAHKYGRPELDIIVRNELAVDRATLIRANVLENIDRRDFDVLEEARAVELLVTECGGRADAAAQQLARTPAWVSQRRALLKLDPQLQAALRAGELAVRLARDLARVPRAEQVAAWEAEQARKAGARDATGDPDTSKDQLTAVNRPRRAPTVRVLTKALSKYEPEPVVLAEALREYLGNDDLLHALVAALETPGGELTA